MRMDVAFRGVERAKRRRRSGPTHSERHFSKSDAQIWLPTRTFSFRQRAGKLDTRAIARVDLEKIVATTDIDTIQRHLENLAFSDVTLEDVQQYSDAYFLKLFQIAQLTLEYLLNVQDSLVSHCENLEAQCESLVQECQTLETENDKIDAEVVGLKKAIRQKQSTLATFEMLLLNATNARRSARQDVNSRGIENDPARRNA
ncbi:hypothetical protein ATCC90586_011304 [Pythium insidiosum]|nr:hypothetical protein ATCC90586_011304 [Pythium insidiosum]